MCSACCTLSGFNFDLFIFSSSSVIMAASVLESSAAFSERALSIGVEQWIVDKFSEKHFASFGKLAFAIPYTPQNADDTPFKQFIEDIIEQPPSQDQLATLRRLFFEAHTMALSDVRSRVEATPDPAVAVKRLPTAERVARQADQEKRLGGIIFTPDVIPSNHIVDLFVEMCESGILTYLKPEQCCSRSMEVSSFKKDPTISTDSSGMLKIGNKHSDITCDAGTELKLRAAWQRQSLAMDLAGLATFSVVESWVQYLFTHLTREQPRGFAKVTLNQLLECDKRLFTIASHRTMGRLKGEAGGDKPLDEIIQELGSSHEILQYLTPYPQVKGHDPPPRGSDEERPNKRPKGDKGAKNDKSKEAGPAKTSSRIQIPEGCSTHDDQNRPLCFKYQVGKCSFKGPAGKRCAKGFHKCYKTGCYRNRPFHQCNHSD